jgi:hypothetical protein
MSYLPTARGAERESVLGARIGRRWDRLIDRGHRLAVDAATRPYRATGAILLLNGALIAAFILVGDLLFSDPAELFRELMPGTWLSFAELLFVAVIAWSIQVASRGERRIRLNNFWGLTAAVFAIFAFDEIMQLTVFLMLALIAGTALRGRVRGSAWAAAIALALAIGVSRVYLGAHYPTDVLAGWLTGGILVVGSWALCARLPVRGTAPAAA